MPPFSIRILPRLLHFKRPAGTSRGVYHTRRVWYVMLRDEVSGKTALGECAPLPGLSCEYDAAYENMLRYFCEQTECMQCVDYEALRAYPSILFGLETAMLHLQSGGFAFFDTPFSRGEQGIRINGLIWMGKYAMMQDQIWHKLDRGFRCLKLKIGALDFDREIALLRYIRSRFPQDQVEIRVDANGAFSKEEAKKKLDRLSEFGLHSIEQPIAAGQWADMAELCRNSPVPIALDEELIGRHTLEEKQALLALLKPAYIVLKPSLHGGICGCEEWMREAEKLRVGHWITSALESNVGLNAIAQWCATLHPRMPQGLGTGMLFADNVPIPLSVCGEELFYLPRTPAAPSGYDAAP